MASRKNRPVLFELASRSRPRVWTSPVAARLQPTAMAPSAGPEQAAAPPAAGLRIIGRKVHLILGWPELLVSAAVLIVLVVTSFQLGARSAQGPGALRSGTDVSDILADQPAARPVVARDVERRDAEPQEAQVGRLSLGHRPANGSVVRTPVAPVPVPAERGESPGGKEPEAPAGVEPTPAFQFKPGYTYVIVQHVSTRSPHAAERIRDFLAVEGIEAVVQPAARDIEVIATQPFLVKQNNAAAAAREKSRCEQLIARIRKLGQKFNIIGGYSFDKCYTRDY